MAFPAPQNHFWAQHHSILLELLLPQLTAARDLVRLAQTCKAVRGVLREERVASLWLRRARFGADANATDAVAAETAWTQIQRRAALERLGARRGTLLPDDPHEYCDCRTLLPPAEERPQPWDICAVGGYVAALDENGDLTLYDPARDRDPRVGEIALHGELVPDADYQEETTRRSYGCPASRRTTSRPLATAARSSGRFPSPAPPPACCGRGSIGVRRRPRCMNHPGPRGIHRE